MQPLVSLPAETVQAVRDLVRIVAETDGVPPLNEEGLLSLNNPNTPARHWLAHHGETLAGYAQWNPEFGTAQIFVHPDYRRQRYGSRLCLSVSATSPHAKFWAFGDLPAARLAAVHLGLSPVRGLLRMGRDLTDADADAPTFRTFTEADVSGFLAVNSAAFADHPEQGRFSLADLDARRAEDWFDPAGLLLSDDDTGVVGFHWTKIAPDQPQAGEVYVIGVHPRAAGRGLGRALLDAGLAHLRSRGCNRVFLYVDEDNEAAVNLYLRSGFDIEHTDRLYGPRV